MLYWHSDDAADVGETDVEGWKKDIHVLQWQNNWENLPMRIENCITYQLILFSEKIVQKNKIGVY